LKKLIKFSIRNCFLKYPYLSEAVNELNFIYFSES
jgi:hypothetical protein